jgi:hypothetical protein
MSDVSTNGIHLTREYYKDFLPTDLQWEVSKIDDDFTLYDLFRLVHHADLMIPGIAATMGMSNFELFWKQIQLDRDPHDKDDVDYLELYWHASYDSRITKKTGKPTDQPDINCKVLDIDNSVNHFEEPKICELPNLMSFHGIGSGCSMKDLEWHECGDDCEKESGYAIEFTPVNNLAHLPIRVSPKVPFFPPHVESDRDFHRTGFELTIEPTLWCFITSIFWELTFAGFTPEEISDHSDEILGRIEEVKEKIDEENKNYNNPDTDSEELI